MRAEHLRRLLRAIVASVGAAGCSVTSGGTNDCPHEVIDRQTTVQLSSSDACTLAGESRTFTGSPPAAACQQACNDGSITRCQLPEAYLTAYNQANPGAGDGGPPTCPALASGSTTVGLDCIVSHTEGSMHSGCPIEGRRPPGLVARRNRQATVGAYFADCAHLEAASVVAFQVLRDELRAHGAPASLVRAAARAASDEVRHARLAGRLAAKHGGQVPAVDAARGPMRSLYEVACDNAVEGVVRETFGAVVALWRAEHAADADVRRAMRVIAEDECRHAALGLAIDAWARARLSEVERRDLDAATRAAIAELESNFAHNPDATLRRDAGVPTAAAAHNLLFHLRRDLWAAAA